MFEKILIANRGEIACRVMRTARRLGVRTAAVYSDADAGALHVAMADEAHPIGPAPARDSYLRAEATIEAARRCSPRAIHHCYGFFAQNAEFAEFVTEFGLFFFGLRAVAIRVMREREAAKDLRARIGVPDG